MFQFTVLTGSICLTVSMLLHGAAGLLPMEPDLRQELRTCTGETGRTGLLFLFFSWIFGIPEGCSGDCSMLLQKYSLCYILMYLLLVVGCSIVNRRRTGEEREICRKLKRSALLYGLACFALAVLLG